MSIDPSMNVESNSTDKQSHCLKQNEYIHQCRNYSSTFWLDLAFLNQNKESRPGSTCKKLGSHHSILIKSKNINRLKHQLFLDSFLGGAVTGQIFAKKNLHLGISFPNYRKSKVKKKITKEDRDKKNTLLIQEQR